MPTTTCAREVVWSACRCANPTHPHGRWPRARITEALAEWDALRLQREYAKADEAAVALRAMGVQLDVRRRSWAHRPWRNGGAPAAHTEGGGAVRGGDR